MTLVKINSQQVSVCAFFFFFLSSFWCAIVFACLQRWCELSGILAVARKQQWHEIQQRWKYRAGSVTLLRRTGNQYPCHPFTGEEKESGKWYGIIPALHGALALTGQSKEFTVQQKDPSLMVWQVESNCRSQTTSAPSGSLPVAATDLQLWSLCHSIPRHASDPFQLQHAYAWVWKLNTFLLSLGNGGGSSG